MATKKHKEGFCTIYENNADTDIFFLHGFRSSASVNKVHARRYADLGYNTIVCDHSEYGRKRKDNIIDVDLTVKELNQLIANRRQKNPGIKKTILVGHSFGGAIAMLSAVNNAKVTKAFALGSPFDDEFIRGENANSYHRLLYEKVLTNEIQVNLPPKGVFTTPCKATNRDRFFLIYSQQDPIVPLSQHDKYVQALCLGKTSQNLPNSFISKTDIPITAHLTLPFKEETNNFILERIDPPHQIQSLSSSSSFSSSRRSKRNHVKSKFSKN